MVQLPHVHSDRLRVDRRRQVAVRFEPALLDKLHERATRDGETSVSWLRELVVREVAARSVREVLHRPAPRVYLRLEAELYDQALAIAHELDVPVAVWVHELAARALGAPAPSRVPSTSDAARDPSCIRSGCSVHPERMHGGRVHPERMHGGEGGVSVLASSSCSCRSCESLSRERHDTNDNTDTRGVRGEAASAPTVAPALETQLGGLLGGLRTLLDRFLGAGATAPAPTTDPGSQVALAVVPATGRASAPDARSDERPVPARATVTQVVATSRGAEVDQGPLERALTELLARHGDADARHAVSAEDLLERFGGRAERAVKHLVIVQAEGRTVIRTPVGFLVSALRNPEFHFDALADACLDEVVGALARRGRTLPAWADPELGERWRKARVAHAPPVVAAAAPAKRTPEEQAALEARLRAWCERSAFLNPAATP